MNRPLHIVSFDVPFPPNYGGVIDVFYKLKALNDLKIDIYLHVFEFGREKQDELKKYCKQVYYYKRGRFVTSFLSSIPFRVKSRANKVLCENLKNINAPILFEGLHTTFPLIKNTFANRKILVRAHNVEHNYFNGLSKSEKNIFKKIFFKTEAIKLSYYEKIIESANHILTISNFEQKYYDQKFGNKAVYIPAFHKNLRIKNLSKQGNFALFHGDLRVADNIKSALFLIEIFREISHPIVFASSFKNNSISKKVATRNNMRYIVIKDGDHIDQLLEKAHINVLPTFQKTGIKLKLINALFNGRFCLVNNEMIEDTGLEKLCEIANTKKEFKQKINELFEKNFTNKEFKKREESIQLKEFNIIKNAQKIIDLIY